MNGDLGPIEFGRPGRVLVGCGDKTGQLDAAMHPSADLPRPYV
jgi:hypothetical protein